MKDMLLDYIRSNSVQLSGLFSGYSQQFNNALEVTAIKRTILGYAVTFDVPSDGYPGELDEHSTEIELDDILVWIWSKQ